MEYRKQENFKSYMDDFRFTIVAKGGEGKRISCSFHWHEFIEILYGVEGVVQVTIENIDYALKPGDMIIMGPKVIHKTYKAFPDTGTMYNIAFDPDIIRNVNYCSLENKCINSFLKYLSDFHYHYLEREQLPEEILEIMRMMEKCYYSHKEYNCIYIRSLLFRLIGLLCEHGLFSVETPQINQSTIDTIMETVEYIQNHYNEKITLADMAERANFSYYYYSKLFKEIVGKNFNNYLASVRVFAAEKMMVDSNDSLQRIGEKVGLYPQSTFYHTYRKLRGFSPNEFLKSVEK